MTMTLITTRNAPPRHRGFLASCMLEITPTVYLAPHLSRAVRERIWAVMLEWTELLPTDAGILMVWNDKHAPSGLAMRFIGWPRTEFIQHEGIWLARRCPPDEPEPQPENNTLDSDDEA